MMVGPFETLEKRKTSIVMNAGRSHFCFLAWSAACGFVTLGAHGTLTAVGNAAAGATASEAGEVTASTDTGHSGSDGSFAMLPDGTINTVLWKDFAERAIHETAVKGKALAEAYYGKAPRYAYWVGASTGGRQGLNLALNNPADFDGILAGYPANNWSNFITTELYPQIVVQRDLGGNYLSNDQLNAVSNAAIQECGNVGDEILSYYGLADQLIPPQGTMHYYRRVNERMGGLEKTQEFYRLYFIPGMGHGLYNGTSNPLANPPLPTMDQLYTLLTYWVEKGKAPEQRVDIGTQATGLFPDVKSRPMCLHPLKARHIGGDPKVASSYECAAS